jgi:hypothetical protein
MNDDAEEKKQETFSIEVDVHRYSLEAVHSKGGCGHHLGTVTWSRNENMLL